MNIDVDTHYIPPGILNMIPADAGDAVRQSVGRYMESYSSVKLRINAMREAGFDKACLLMQGSTIPDPFINRRLSVTLTRAWNDQVAKVAKEHEEFIGVAQVSHQDVDAAIEEAERAVHQLGFNAIQIVGHWGERSIEDPEWWPFFQKVERLGVPLWFHTSGNYGSGRINPRLPGNDHLRRLPPVVGVLLGFLWHAQLVAAGLIFAGVLEKFPRLRVVLTECDAGWVPSFMDWLDSLYLSYLSYKQEGRIKIWYDESQIVQDLKMRRKPSEYLRENFYYGLITTNGYSIDEMIPWLVNSIGLKNLMIESDYPHSEGSLDIVRRVGHLRRVDGETRQRILGRNAADLLKLKWAPSSYAV